MGLCGSLPVDSPRASPRYAASQQGRAAAARVNWRRAHTNKNIRAEKIPGRSRCPDWLRTGHRERGIMALTDVWGAPFQFGFSSWCQMLPGCVGEWL